MKRHLGLCSLAVLALVTASAEAATKLPSVIGDHMVLQRDRAVPVWGWDDAGTEVSVSIGSHSAKVTADDEGKWVAMLPAMSAGGPHQLTVKGTTTVEVKDILVGEVWFCSGQSNMEWTVSRSDNAQEEIAAADHPRIRHIKIPHRPADTPQDDVPSDGWKVTTPETVPNFTAVGYYFGRYLQKELDVPIGLIGCNWGGTRIEPWTPPSGFEAVPALKSITDNLDKFPSKTAEGKINHQTPLALYNGMVAPIVPFAVRGAIWYQGESNNGEGMLYFEKMKALISGWRDLWENPEMPFYFVQLAPYKYGGDPERLAGIWEAQQASLSIPYTGMAVTVDIGNIADIHPTNKQDVGKRLALWALAKDYGRDGLVYSGPLYKSMKVEGETIRVSFDHVGGGLKSRDDKPLTHWQVAGGDGEWVDAEAKIDGDTVVVWSDSVSKPTAVRFGWNQLAEPNLSNAEGLPAGPFRAPSGE